MRHRCNLTLCDARRCQRMPRWNSWKQTFRKQYLRSLWSVLPHVRLKSGWMVFMFVTGLLACVFSVQTTGTYPTKSALCYTMLICQNVFALLTLPIFLAFSGGPLKQNPRLEKGMELIAYIWVNLNKLVLERESSPLEAQLGEKSIRSKRIRII